MKTILLRATLALCPPEFRHDHMDSIADDVRGGPESDSPFEFLATCADVAFTGLRMQFEEVLRNGAFCRCNHSSLKHHRWIPRHSRESRWSLSLARSLLH